MTTNPLTPARRQAIETLHTLGRPDVTGLAFFDMDSDCVLFSNSNVHLTVGDVRELQALLAEKGFPRPITRLDALQRMLKTEGEA